MTPEEDKKLCTDFPKLYAQRDSSPAQSCLAFGFECGSGWFNLIYELSAKLEALNDGVEALQVKEKYGTLRFYTNHTSDKIAEYIREAERLSAITCELCGSNQGKLIEGGWAYTLCSTCEEGRKKNKNEKV